MSTSTCIDYSSVVDLPPLYTAFTLLRLRWEILDRVIKLLEQSSLSLSPCFVLDDIEHNAQA